LDKAVMKQLKPLRLDKARFLTHTERLKPDGHGICGGPAGLDTVMFLVAANEGAVPGPMMKVASGGELARFILALKAVAAQQGGSPVMVFDEIDTGVGGATAAAIGERLYRLGQRSQVIAVTHSAQVAAYADQHYRLHKTNRGNGSSVLVQTLAERLDNHGRREEIARMLAGAVITDEARAAAVKLMGAKP
jgi:DNA repair protein RecN (Recombination protein N)